MLSEWRGPSALKLLDLKFSTVAKKGRKSFQAVDSKKEEEH